MFFITMLLETLECLLMSLFLILRPIFFQEKNHFDKFFTHYLIQIIYIFKKEIERKSYELKLIYRIIESRNLLQNCELIISILTK